MSHDAQITALVTEQAEPADSPAPTFVFVHGLGVSSWYFEPLFEELAGSAPMILLDLPGFGRAPEPERELRVGGLADALIATIRERQLHDVVLVGHSMGAQVVVEALAREPSLARAAVLITPVVAPQDRKPWRVVLQFTRASLHEEVRSAYRSVLTFLSTNPLWIAKHFRAMTEYRIEEQIGEIPPDIPILLIRGSNDHLSSRAFLRLLQERTQHFHNGGCAIIRELRGGSHQVMSSHAPAVATALLRMCEPPA